MSLPRDDAYHYGGPPAVYACCDCGITRRWGFQPVETLGALLRCVRCGKPTWHLFEPHPKARGRPSDRREVPRDNGQRVVPGSPE